MKTNMHKGGGVVSGGKKKKGGRVYIESRALISQTTLEPWKVILVPAKEEGYRDGR